MSGAMPENTGGKSDYNPGDKSKAYQSDITSPEQDQTKEEKLKRIVVDTTNQIIEAKLQPFEKEVANMKGTLDQVVQILNQMTQPQQNQTQQTQQGTVNDWNKLNPEDQKAAALDFVKTIIEGYKMYKGEVGGQTQTGGFQQMMAEWGMRMFQYHLDNMAQSVYQIRLPPSPEVQKRLQQGQPKAPTNLQFE